MITKLAAINIFQNLYGLEVDFKKLIEKNKENMNTNEQSQTIVILAGLNKFNRKQHNLNGFNKKEYLLLFKKSLVVIISKC